jgi:hypothetical protein
MRSQPLAATFRVHLKCGIVAGTQKILSNLNQLSTYMVLHVDHSKFFLKVIPQQAE